MTACSEQLTFSFHPDKEVTADFEGGLISSDAGLLPIRELDERLGWTARVADILGEPREAGQVDHPMLELVQQRLYGLVGGYQDGNDHTRLRHDPILKGIVGCTLDETLGSQPTISRFENAVTPQQIAALNRELIEQFIQVHRRRRPKRLVLDIDPTDDPCHGQQQLALFNAFYNQYMYLPVLVFERASGMLVGVRLQAGTAGAARRAAQVLKPIVTRLRQQWPKVRIRIRADAGFASPSVYRFCEDHDLEYLIGFSATKPLKERTHWALTWLQERFERDGTPCRHRGGFSYQAGTWDRSRRVLYKVEVGPPGTNRRFLVTNCRGTPHDLWPDYDDRGTAETFIDDFKNGLGADRLSCHRFVANAFRLMLTAVAYNLLRMFRTLLADTEFETASVETIRSRLIKIGARVRETVRRLWVHLPTSFALREVLKHCLSRLAAIPAAPLS